MTVSASNIHLYRALLDIADDEDDVDATIARRRLLPKYADVMKGPLPLSVLTKRAASKETWIAKYITNCTNKAQLGHKFIVAGVTVPDNSNLLTDPHLPDWKAEMIDNMKDETLFPYKWGLPLPQYKKYSDEITKANAPEPVAKEEKKAAEPDAVAIVSSTGNAIISCVNACHNTMRNNDALFGTDAMHDIMRLLFMKFMEPLIDDGTIDILDPKYYTKDQYYKPGMEKYAKFSIFKDNTISTSADVTNDMWKTIMFNHPLTKKIFHNKDNFNCSQQTLVDLIEHISKSLKDETFDSLDNDIKGKVYEEFLNGYSNNAGKDFGQYFTVRKYIKTIFDMIGADHVESFKQQITAKTFTVYDPCMGTAGFLMEAYKFFDLEKDMIYGREIVASTYSFALMNVVLTTGTVIDANIKCANSLVECDPLTKVAFMPTNPPYGIKVKYEELRDKYNALYKNEPATFPKFKDVYPIKTNDSVALFLQMMVYKLQVGGVCTPIIPDGQLLFGKNFGKLRKYIMSKCRVKKILYTPGGVFKHAGVKTAVLFLVKADGDNADCDMACFTTTKQLDTPAHNTTVTVNEENNWSWDMSYYTVQETPNLGGCEWKPLGELCEFVMGSRITKSNGSTGGEYPVYGGGYETFRTDTFNRSGRTCKIGRFGVSLINCVQVLNFEYFLNDSGFTISTQNEIVYNNYLYHFLERSRNDIYNICQGAGQKNMDMIKFKQFKIPVPSFDVQVAIVAELDQLEIAKASTTNEIASMKQTLEQYRKHENPPFAEYQDEIKWTPLGELCVVKTGKNKPSDNKTGSLYPYYGTGGITGYTDEYLFDGSYILTARNGTIGNCFNVTGKFFPSDHMFAINCENNITQKYIYHFISGNERLIKMKTGATIPNITKDGLEKFKIPVPSLEVQAAFVVFYEAKEQKIIGLKADITKAEERLQWLDELGRTIIKNMISAQ
jgi:type I restriction enzyme S subunit